MTLMLQATACGGKGGSSSSDDDDDGTINPPPPSSEMKITSGVFFSGTKSGSDDHALTSYFTSYQTTTMGSDQFTALDVTIQTVDDEN